MRSINAIKYLFVSMIAMGIWTASTPANAKYRRHLAVGTCQSNSYWTPNDGSSYVMNGLTMTGDSGTWRYLACPMLSDSYFTSSEFDTINVHTNVTSGYIRASICVYDSMTNTTYCGSSQDTSGTGEVYLQFTGSYLDVLSEHPYCDPFVKIRTLTSGNTVRLIYVGGD